MEQRAVASIGVSVALAFELYFLLRCAVMFCRTDESSENQHRQANVAQLGVVTVANMVVFFTVGFVLLCPELDGDFAHGLSGSLNAARGGGRVELGRAN